MSEKLTLYSNPMSRGRIARWMMEEAGAPYEVQYIQYGEAMKSPPFTEINPMGKVPALVHGDTVVTECAAICAYMADAFPEAGLAPALSDRGNYYRWLFFAAGPVEAATTNRAAGFEFEAYKQSMAGYGTFDLMHQTLVNAVSRADYVCGDQFTAADVYIGSQVGWGLQFGSIPAHPALEAYSQRVYAREAFKRAAELDNAAMAEFGTQPL